MNASAAEMSLARAGRMIRTVLSSEEGSNVAGRAAKRQARRRAPGLIVLCHKPGIVQPVGGRARVRLEFEPHGATQRGGKAPAEQQRPAVQHLRSQPRLRYTCLQVGRVSGGATRQGLDPPSALTK